MNPLILLNTDETPSVNFDKAKGIFRIAENSYPDDARRFYEPVFAWLEKYFQEPNTTTVFEFALQLFLWKKTAKKKTIKPSATTY